MPDLRPIKEVRSQDGKLYSRSSLIGLRSGIQRHIESPPYNRTINIARDSDFKPANLVLKGRLKMNRAAGLDVTKHKDAIEPGDIAKMYDTKVLSNDNPKALQYKVFFEISLHFARRGREGLRELKPSAFVFKKDDNDEEYATIIHNEKTKKDQGTKTDFLEKDQRMYGRPESPLCPLASLKTYISKLNPKADTFFQQPRTCANVNEKDVWYNGRPVGPNTIANFMPKISQEAGLSKAYTNHCIRATVITLLANEGVDATDTIAITGHKNVQSLLPYLRKLGDDKRRHIGAKLHAHCNQADEASAKENTDPSATISKPPSQAVCSLNTAPKTASWVAKSEIDGLVHGNTINAQQVYFNVIIKKD